MKEIVFLFSYLSIVDSCCTDLVAISLNLYCKMVQMGSAIIPLLCHINIEQCTELIKYENSTLYN